MPGADPIKFDLYISTGTWIDDDGFHTIQPDSYGDGGTDPIECLYPSGAFMRPLDPVLDENGEPTEGAPMLVGWDGGKRFAIPMMDKRVTDLLPKINPGETIVPNGFGSFIRLKDDGTIVIYTTGDGTPTGESVYFQVKKDKFEWVSPWGVARFDASGFHVRGHGGERLDMGSIGGMPALPMLGALSTYCNIDAQMIKLRGTFVSLGADSPTSDAPAKSTPITVYVSAIATYVAALNAAITTALGALAPAAVPAGAVTAFNGAIAAPLAALSAAATVLSQTMPSTASTVT